MRTPNQRTTWIYCAKYPLSLSRPFRKKKIKRKMIWLFICFCYFFSRIYTFVVLSRGGYAFFALFTLKISFFVFDVANMRVSCGWFRIYTRWFFLLVSCIRLSLKFKSLLLVMCASVVYGDATVDTFKSNSIVLRSR